MTFSMYAQIVMLVCAIAETATVDLVFASFALGAGGAALASVCGASNTASVIIGCVLALFSLVVIRPALRKRLTVNDEPIGLETLAGQIATVTSPTTVKVAGEVWSLTHPLDSSYAVGDTVRVRGVVGASLDVGPLSEFYTNP